MNHFSTNFELTVLINILSKLNSNYLGKAYLKLLINRATHDRPQGIVLGSVVTFSDR